MFSIFRHISKEEKEIFIEHLSLLLDSGMSIVPAFEALTSDIRGKFFRKMLCHIQMDLEAGSPLWKTFEETRLFSQQMIQLLRTGEEGGRLINHLQMIARNQQKERALRSKIRSAMMYPFIVLSLAVVVGLGTAWFVLPRLVTVFSQLNMSLPLPTRALIGIGELLSRYGFIIIPLFVFVLVFGITLLFIHQKTRAIGHAFLFHIPGTRKLIQEVEIARFGFVFGSLLEAGLPIDQALHSLQSATVFGPFSAFYQKIEWSITQGNSFQQTFQLFPQPAKLFPSAILQTIVAGEESGRLSDMLIKIGSAYEDKVDETAKNVSVLLEPILLIVIWLVVAGVALSIILPVYSLIGGIQP